jgi:hypothetical protein
VQQPSLQQQQMLCSTTSVDAWEWLEVQGTRGTYTHRGTPPQPHPDNAGVWYVCGI